MISVRKEEQSGPVAEVTFTAPQTCCGQPCAVETQLTEMILPPFPHLLLLLVEFLSAWQAREVQWWGTSSACGTRKEMLENRSSLEVAAPGVCKGGNSVQSEPSVYRQGYLGLSIKLC